MYFQGSASKPSSDEGTVNIDAAFALIFTAVPGSSSRMSSGTNEACIHSWVKSHVSMRAPVSAQGDLYLYTAIIIDD